jgi:hypothetical protein
LIELVESSARKSPIAPSAIPSGVGLRMEQTLEQFNQASAARLFRAHALADQVQLLPMLGTEIRSAADATEQAHQEAALAVQLSLAAIPEEKDHRYRDHSGF